MPHMLPLIAVLITLVLSPTKPAADVSRTGSDFCSRSIARLDIHDRIHRQDADAVARALACREGSHTMIMLNSPGGSVQAALAIAEALRENALDGGDSISVNVRSDYRCHSACALVFAAGPYKSNHGVVGLHRPYFTGFQGEDIADSFRALRDRLDAFARSYGLSSAFVDEMMVTDSDDVAIYRGEGIFDLVPREDPVVEHRRIEREAAYHHTDPASMRARKQRARERCGDLPRGQGESAMDRWTTCRRAAEWGVSTKRFRAHRAQIERCFRQHSAKQARGDCVHRALTRSTPRGTTSGSAVDGPFEVDNSDLFEGLPDRAGSR